MCHKFSHICKPTQLNTIYLKVEDVRQSVNYLNITYDLPKYTAYLILTLPVTDQIPAHSTYIFQS